jgi:opacity protein-like surface antigen
MRRVLCAALLLLSASPLSAQQPVVSDAEREARLARRGAGVRLGFWEVDVATAANPSTSPHFEGYFQRGMDQHLALENSVGVWWVNTTDTTALPGSAIVETQAWIVPLLTSLKFYPLTRIGARIEPYVLAGLGFAFGVEERSENAIGGGGTTIVTGFGFRAGLGVEVKLVGAFGLSAAGKYQWMHYGEELVGMETFRGVGADGGITYRFQF